MNFSDTIKSRIDVVCNTRAALFSFAEYIDSAVSKTTKFISDDGNISEYISLPLTGQHNDTQVTAVVALSKEQYELAFDPDSEEETIDIVFTDSGDTMSVQKDTLQESIENYVAELKTQKEYVKYCLSSAEVKVSEFYQKIAALTNAVPGYILEKYGALIETAGSPVEALKNFISLHTQVEYVATDQYVELVNPDDYTGNVWLSVWNQVVDDITYFFKDVVWKGITQIGDFFKSIWNGLLNLLKWGVGQLFGQFLTDYEKASNAFQGIMDFPLFQIDLGEANINVDGTVDHQRPSLRIAAPLTSGISYSGDGYNKQLNWAQVGAYNPYNTYWLQRAILNMVIEQFNDKLYRRTMDVTVPCDDNPYDLCLRLGWGQNDHIYLSGYVVCNYSDWSKNDDLTNNQIITDNSPSGIIAAAMQNISKIVPLLDTEPYYADISFKWGLIAGNFVSAKYQEGDVLVELFTKLNYDFSYLNTSTAYIKKIIYGMLIYMCIMSVGFQSWERLTPNDPLTLSDYTDSVLSTLFAANTSTYTPDPGSVYPYKAILDPSGWDNSIIKKSTLFTPYLTRDVLPTTVHYQTLSDRANEVIKAIRTVLVVAVAIYVGVKMYKFSKNFKVNAFIAENEASMRSWDLVADPDNPNKRKAFLKAYKKMKHIQLLGNILGLTTQAATTAKNSVDASSFFVKSNSAASDYSKDTANKIIKLIRGY